MDVPQICTVIEQRRCRGKRQRQSSCGRATGTKPLTIDEYKRNETHHRTTRLYSCTMWWLLSGMVSQITAGELFVHCVLRGVVLTTWVRVVKNSKIPKANIDDIVGDWFFFFDFLHVHTHHRINNNTKTFIHLEK